MNVYSHTAINGNTKLKINQNAGTAMATLNAITNGTAIFHLLLIFGVPQQQWNHFPKKPFGFAASYSSTASFSYSFLFDEFSCFLFDASSLALFLIF